MTIASSTTIIKTKATFSTVIIGEPILLFFAYSIAKPVQTIAMIGRSSPGPLILLIISPSQINSSWYFQKYEQLNNTLQILYRQACSASCVINDTTRPPNIDYFSNLYYYSIRSRHRKKEQKDEEQVEAGKASARFAG